MIKTTDFKCPRYHMKKVDHMERYIEFVSERNAGMTEDYNSCKKLCKSLGRSFKTKYEAHHCVPACLQPAGNVIVALTHADHVKAHQLLTLALLQFKQYDIINKISYNDPLPLVSDAEYWKRVRIGMRMHKCVVWFTSREFQFFFKKLSHKQVFLRRALSFTIGVRKKKVFNHEVVIATI